MAFEDRIKEARLDMQYLVVLTFTDCQNTYGVDPCTAGRRATGTAQSGTDRSIRLNAGASATDDEFNGMVVRLTGGTGSGQERTILDYDGTTKDASVTVAWDTNPDVTSDFDIINRPEACFNTRFTCQDPENFVTGTREVKHSNKDRPLPLPGEVTIPDLIKVPLYKPVEIDPRKGKIKNSSISLDFADEPTNDVGEDKYLEHRAYNPLDQGTRWTKFNARNPHYNGRNAEIKRGLFGDTEAEMEVSLNFIESLKLKGKKVTMTFKDRLKVLDKTDLPEATGITVDGAVSAGAATVPVSDATKLLDPVATSRNEYIAVEENVIQYTGISGNNLTGATWQEFGTSEADLTDGESVQQCWGFEAANAADIAHFLLNDVGIEDADIDVAGLEQDRDDWLLSAIFTGIWVKPTKAKKILEELQLQSMFSVYWDEVAQKVKLKVTAPPSPTDFILKLTDDDFLEVPDFDNNEASRLSRVAIAYLKRSAFSDQGDWESYAKASVVIDKDAESADQYGEPAIQNIFSRWITTDTWAQRVRNRLFSRFRDRAPILLLQVAPKDSEIAPADIIEITTERFVDQFGAPLQNRQIQILSRKQKGEERFDLKVMDTAWSPGGVSGGRYGFIAPTGHPDYDDATEEQRKYAFVGATSDNSVGVNDDPGYYIF